MAEEEKKLIDYADREKVKFLDQPVKWIIYQIFPRLSMRDYYARKWMWIIAVLLDFCFMGMLVISMIWAGNQCYITGLHELNQSCELCLGSCIKDGIVKDYNGNWINTSKNWSNYGMNISIKDVSQ